MIVVFTEHARDRYDRRIPHGLPLEVVAEAGQLQHWCPATLVGPETADAWLVHGDAVFPLKRDRGVLVAVTCLRRRPRLSKADRRARRDLARDYMEAA